MPRLGAKDRQAGLHEVQGDARKSKCPPMGFGGAPGPGELKGERGRGCNTAQHGGAHEQSKKAPPHWLEIPRSASGWLPGQNQDGLKSVPGQFRRSKVLMPLYDRGIRIDTSCVNMSYEFHTCHTGQEGSPMRIWSFV